MTLRGNLQGTTHRPLSQRSSCWTCSGGRGGHRRQRPRPVSSHISPNPLNLPLAPLSVPCPQAASRLICSAEQAQPPRAHCLGATPALQQEVSPSVWQAFPRSGVCDPLRPVFGPFDRRCLASVGPAAGARALWVPPRLLPAGPGCLRGLES